MEHSAGNPHRLHTGNPKPVPALLGALFMVVLLVTLFVFVLPLALLLLAAAILIGLFIRAKKAIDNLGQSRRDREGRKNVRIINR